MSGGVQVPGSQTEVPQISGLSTNTTPSPALPVMHSSGPSPASSAFSSAPRAQFPTSGSQDSLFTLPPPLPAHPPRLASLPHEDGPGAADTSNGSAGDWGSLFSITAGGQDDKENAGRPAREEVVKLEQDLSKRRSLASKMAQELEDLQRRLEQAEARERALRGGQAAGGQAPRTTGATGAAQQRVPTA